MHPKMKPKNNMKHERFWLPKCIQNGAKMRGTIVEMAPWEASENDLEFFYSFGVPLDPFWHPFRRLLAILGAFRPPSGSLLASLRLSFRQPLEAFRSAENLPRFRRELAEIPPRTCRGSAENPPRTSQEPAV